MSKKNIAQAKAAKRTARAKAKAKSVAKAKATPQAIKHRQLRGALNADGRIADFDTVLENAVLDINKRKQVQSEFKNSTDMIKGIKEAIGQVFKLYCYVTLGKTLADSGAMQHEVQIPLDDISRVLMNFDSRIGRLEYMNQTPEDQRDDVAIETEAFDIGTNLANISEDLYGEVARMEKHSLIMEEAISRMSLEITEGSPEERRMRALQAVAYKYLAELKLHDAKVEKEQREAAEAEQHLSGVDEAPSIPQV
ncbi:hypothetical protein YUBABA_02520 [Serratia phage vB_SmaM-Yubaba]|nr:hypothetical protein YUBABA_02520 [Serratia phage vB_SmaM-Yubaba]